MARLKDLYKKDVVGNLMKKFDYKNVNQVPRLEKITINSCSRDCLVNSKTAAKMADELSVISGQKAVIAKAKKSVAGFKLREGQSLGATVTLRGETMYEFLDRLVSCLLYTSPSPRDRTRSRMPSSA